MKPAWRAADRAAELLAAARGWRAAGLIDHEAFGAIAAAHAPSGPRLGLPLRALVFVCVVVGVATATAVGFFTLGVREPAGAALLLLLLGALLAVVTDLLVDRCRFQPTGAAAATALLAAGYLGLFAHALLEARDVRGHQALLLLFPWCAATCSLLWWRWGFRLLAGAAGVFVLLFAARLPAPRLSWVAAAALLAAGASAVLSRRELAPSHRDGVGLVRVVALAALYLGVNHLSVDRGWIEELARVAGAPRHRADALALVASGIGSALLPPAILVWGLRARDRVLIDAGLVATALSLATFFFLVPVAPPWAVLAAAGAGLAGASLLLERRLRSGPGGERAGFTAAQLCGRGWSDRLLAAAAPAAAPAGSAPPDGGPAPLGGGGAFGGGGVSGSL